ncbi:MULTISPECIES: hypothetical protein [unclassified Streptomyces]|uniref:hypothetical protein n=1 Tax=unclassified Streptomyces TaxID=2593676 RepID=UPI002E138966|nr:hypothetical protein OG457_13025 [Streptomyces sp. NBC_01207]WTA17991.1 hypothetical protein OG365_07925 [Streptomyces sp. NBC_00853]
MSSRSASASTRTSRFDAWAVDGIELEGNNPNYQLTMNANRTINALFVPIPQP